MHAAHGCKLASRVCFAGCNAGATYRQYIAPATRVSVDMSTAADSVSHVCLAHFPHCRGSVSTSNSGGFVSVRCKNFEPALDLAAYSGLKLRLLGNGLRYKCIIRTDSGWDGVGYCRWVLV
jgi:hypothetical protein